MAMFFCDYHFLHAHNRFDMFGLIDNKKKVKWFVIKTIDCQILNL